MPQLIKPVQLGSWLPIGLFGIFIFSVCIRFWGLGRFNTLVFDEVYYVKFANNYLTQTPFFDGHPPLSKYLIAIGIWLGQRFPFGQMPTNELAGSPLSPWSYRWFNALVGSFLPVLVAAIAHQISHRLSFTLIAGSFAALDGMLLVESRYGLNNVYLLLFGLLGQWFFLITLGRRHHQWLWLTLSGISFGAAIAIKWNGLWFLLGTYGLWGVAWVIRWLLPPQLGSDRSMIREGYNQKTTLQAAQKVKPTPISPFNRLTDLRPAAILIYLTILPVTVYSLLWIPHLHLNPTPDFWKVQTDIYNYHQRVGGNDPKVHPYCSPWYTWPLMVRPVSYFYETGVSPQDEVPLTPKPSGGSVIFDVHSMGNPILWWSSTAAIGLLTLLTFHDLRRLISTRWQKGVSALQEQGYRLAVERFWVPAYLLLNYGINWLPWIRVSRCTFLYHHLGAAMFGTLAIAWLVDRWLQLEVTVLSPNYRPQLRSLGISISCLVILAFAFWLPVYLGLPLSPLGFRLRMWFPSWV